MFDANHDGRVTRPPSPLARFDPVPVPTVLAVAEVPAILRVSRSVVYELLSTGALQSYTIGRRRYVTGAALLEFIEARQAEAQA